MTRPSTFEYKCHYPELIGTAYEDKCPDLKIGNLYYEHEGFVSNNAKRAFRNMINHGMEQPIRIIIDAPNLTDAYMKRVIRQRIADGQNITEVWISNPDGTLKLLYKKTDG